MAQSAAANNSAAVTIKSVIPTAAAVNFEDVFGSYGRSTKAQNPNSTQGDFYFTTESMSK